MIITKLTLILKAKTQIDLCFHWHYWKTTISGTLIEVCEGPHTTDKRSFLIAIKFNAVLLSVFSSNESMSSDCSHFYYFLWWLLSEMIKDDHPMSPPPLNFFKIQIDSLLNIKKCMYEYDTCLQEKIMSLLLALRISLFMHRPENGAAQAVVYTRGWEPHKVPNWECNPIVWSLGTDQLGLDTTFGYIIFCTVQCRELMLMLKCGLAFAKIDHEDNCKYFTVKGNKFVNYNSERSLQCQSMGTGK